MSIQLQPYGPLVSILGAAPVTTDIAAKTAGELLTGLHAAYPGLAPWQGRIACAQGEHILKASSILDKNTAVALIPPVSGG